MHKLEKVLLMKRGSLPLELLVDDQLDRGRVLVHDVVAGHVRRELVLIVSFTLVLLVQLVLASLLRPLSFPGRGQGEPP